MTASAVTVSPTPAITSGAPWFEGDQLIGVAEGQNTHHRPNNLFSSNFHVISGIIEDCQLDKKPLSPTQLREAIVTRDATIRRLNGMLAEKITHERSAAPNPRPQEQADEVMALRELVAALQQRLATEVARRERTEQRHALLRATLSEAQTALRDAYTQAQQLSDEWAAAEAQLAPPQDADAESQRTLPAYLKGARLLYVGGRHGHIQRIRAFVEEAQAEFLHHDGGVEERKGLLARIVSRADAIFFPVDCVSHDTVAVVKRLCRQTGKPYLPLRSTSLTSFIASLRRFEWSGLDRRTQPF